MRNALALTTPLLLLVATSAAAQSELVRLPMHGFSVGPYFEYVCPTEPAGSVRKSRGLLVGVYGSAGVWVDSVGGLCAQLIHIQTPIGAAGYTTTVRRSPSMSGQAFGNAQGGRGSAARCDDEQGSVTGVRTQNYRHDSTLALIEPLCYTGSATPSSAGSIQGRGEKGPVDTEHCPPGTRAVGVRGHADQFVRMFGLICAQPYPAAPTPPPPTGERTLNKRKLPEDDTAAKTLNKRRRPGSGSETSAAAAAGALAEARAAVNPAIYDQYAGRYQVSLGRIITITREGDRLYVTDLESHLVGRKYELIPQSETQFLVHSTEAGVRFIRNRDGVVYRLEYFGPQSGPVGAMKLR